MRVIVKVTTNRYRILALALLIAPVVNAQSKWGFSVASTEYYFPDSTHQEYCFFSKTIDVSTLDCSKTPTASIDGIPREQTKVLSECVSHWFFARLKATSNPAVVGIINERALISQVERYSDKHRDCADYDVPCLYASEKEAERERQAFMKRAKKLGAKVFEIE